jgi:hypothetical protein
MVDAAHRGHGHGRKSLEAYGGPKTKGKAGIRSRSRDAPAVQAGAARTAGGRVRLLSKGHRQGDQS